MAKVLIELEDIEGGKVTVAVTPAAASLMEKHYNTTEGLTSAESYGLYVVNRLREAAQEEAHGSSAIAVSKDDIAKAKALPIPGKKNPY